MSNKTPNENVAKTKSAHRVTPLLLAIVLAVSLGIVGVVWGARQLIANKYEPKSSDEMYCLQLPNFSDRLGCRGATLSIADTDEARTQGLSGVKSMTDHEGMLFIFDEAGQQCMWMKDMNFSLDIVWLDQSKTITRIEHDLSPDTYPQTYCQDNTKYVIELHSGVSDKSGISIGKKLVF